MGLFGGNKSGNGYESVNTTPQKTPEEIQAENERRRKLEVMPVSTTDSIDGYKTSGSRIILSTTVSINTGYLSIKYYEVENEKSKREAIENLKNSALENNCNAVVGLRFEFNHFVVQDKVHTYLSAYATGIKIVGKV